MVSTIYKKVIDIPKLQWPSGLYVNRKEIYARLVTDTKILAKIRTVLQNFWLTNFSLLFAADVSGVSLKISENILFCQNPSKWGFQNLIGKKELAHSFSIGPKIISITKRHIIHISHFNSSMDDVPRFYTNRQL